jgi:hypothetical protein
MAGLLSQIENRNFLSPTGFKFTLTRAPKVAFFCNRANIPELTLGIAVQPSYLKDIDRPGDKIEFGDLTLTFMIDENLENYMEIQNWIRGLGYPENLNQYEELKRTATIDEKYYLKSPEKVYSDGTLEVLSSSMIPNFMVNFKDLFPYSLATMQFNASESDIQYFTADVTFKYTIYNITDLSGNPL